MRFGVAERAGGDHPGRIDAHREPCALVGFLPPGLMLVVAVLVVLRFLFGAFQAGTFPAISRMMADWMPTTERGSAQGAVWMSSRMGGCLAPPLLVWMFLAMHDWKMPLVMVAVLGLLWCAVFWPWFRNQPEEMPQVNRRERKLIEAGRLGPGRARARPGPLGADAAVAERLVALPDVRVPRLQRQLLPDAAADVPEEPPPPRLADHRAC